MFIYLLFLIMYERRCEKTCLRGFQPELTNWTVQPQKMVTGLKVQERLYSSRNENNVKVSVTAQLICVFDYACFKVRSFLRGSFIGRRHVENLMIIEEKSFYSFKMICGCKLESFYLLIHFGIAEPLFIN